MSKFYSLTSYQAKLQFLVSQDAIRFGACSAEKSEAGVHKVLVGVAGREVDEFMTFHKDSSDALERLNLKSSGMSTMLFSHPEWSYYFVNLDSVNFAHFRSGEGGSLRLVFDDSALEFHESNYLQDRNVTDSLYETNFYSFPCYDNKGVVVENETYFINVGRISTIETCVNDYSQISARVTFVDSTQKLYVFSSKEEVSNLFRAVQD